MTQIEKIFDLIEKLEEYEFRDAVGHPLENCRDWNELKVAVGYFAEADADEARRDMGNV